MTPALKKCLKLRKLFAAELAHSTQLESEGFQVLSSLANVSQRLPTLLTSKDQSRALGVLQYSCNTHALLLQKHWWALEQSGSFLTEIVRNYQELVHRLRSFTNECVALVDEALSESDRAANQVALIMEVQEYMDTVLAMFEHEVLRKTRLVANLEYSDPKRLSAVWKQWRATGEMGNIDNDYVQTGLQVPQARATPLEAKFLIGKEAKKAAK